MIASETSCSRAYAPNTGGFTLIEMLVSVTLMALIGIAITEGLHLARRSLQSTARADRDSWEVVASQRFLRHALESAEPSSTAPGASGVLRGDGSHITFRAEGPQSVNEGIPSLFEIRLVAREHDLDQQDLIVRWQPQTSETDLTSDDSSPSEVLVTGVQSVRWQYLPAALSTGGTADSSDWLDEWQGRTDLPALIRLEVTFKPGSPRIWPPLVVQLHLTHDAGCVFDVVAQDCRKEG